MDKNQLLTAFNEHFLEFVGDIERVFPKNLDIMATKKTLSQAVTFVPKTPLKMFREYFVDLYSAEIDAGNLNFFIDNNYRQDATKTNIASSVKETNNLLDKIDGLRQPVREMSEENKAKVIKYLQNLKKLSDLYLDMKKNK